MHAATQVNLKILVLEKKPTKCRFGLGLSSDTQCTSIGLGRRLSVNREQKVKNLSVSCSEGCAIQGTYKHQETAQTHWANFIACKSYLSVFSNQIPGPLPPLYAYHFPVATQQWKSILLFPQPWLRLVWVQTVLPDREPAGSLALHQTWVISRRKQLKKKVHYYPVLQRGVTARVTTPE